MTHLSPMAVVERVIGPPEQIALIIRSASKSPYGWRGASLKRDAGDIPSARHMRALLAHAAARGLPLLAEDLIWGVSEDVLKARLEAAENSPPGASANSSPGGQTGGGVAVPVPADFSADAEGADFSAEIEFRSRAGQRGPVGALQAAPATRAGVEAPRPAPHFITGALRHG